MSLFYCCCFVFVFPSGNGEQFHIQHHYFICIPFIFDTINELLLVMLVIFFMENKFISLDFEFWVLVCIKYLFYLISVSISGWSFDWQEVQPEECTLFPHSRVACFHENGAEKSSCLYAKPTKAHHNLMRFSSVFFVFWE